MRSGVNTPTSDSDTVTGTARGYLSPFVPERKPPIRPLARDVCALIVGTGLIGLSLLALRWLSRSFPPGTTTAEHPVFTVLAALLLGGLAWMTTFPALRRLADGGAPTGRVLLFGLAAGLLFRAMFFGSHAIYEDDFRRYLWDGAVVAYGLDPYAHSPAEVSAQAQASDSAALEELRELDREAGGLTRGINNPRLTTIYPPVAQSAFAAAAVLRPFDPDALRAVFLLLEAASFALFALALRAYGRDPVWALAYALCPLVAFAGFNTLHMDILLVPWLLLALLWVGRRPALAAVALAGAVGVKVWPLVLGPVLFRQYRTRPLRYVGYGVLLGGLSLVVMWPMLRGLGASSGLEAYSAGWVRSSFLFPRLEGALSGLADDPGRVARLLVAGAVAGLSLVLALVARPDPMRLPLALMAVTLALLFLSPTGYPWYAIWVAAFLPFVPSRGAALLCVGVSLYYIRFWLGERGDYGIYTDVLVPLHFGLPLVVLAVEGSVAWRGRRLA